MLASIFIVILVVSDMSYYSASYSRLMDIEALYTNMVNVESVSEMVRSTAPNYSNTSQFSSWMAAMRLVAGTDGIFLYQYNSTLVLRTKSSPVVYSTISLN